MNLVHQGVTLTWSGALLSQVDDFFALRLQLPVRVADDPWRLSRGYSLCPAEITPIWKAPRFNRFRCPSTGPASYHIDKFIRDNNDLYHLLSGQQGCHLIPVQDEFLDFLPGQTCRHLHPVFYLTVNLDY